MIIPDDMIEVTGKIFGGEYDIPRYVKTDPVILDIGAGIGGFTRWAKYRWYNATVYAYEPLPECAEFFLKNTEDLKNVFFEQCALGAKSDKRMLYYGGNTRAMNSFEKSEYTRDYGVEVLVKSAKEAPYADIVKCDTEGAEIEILSNIPYDPHIILVEYHSLKDRDTLEQMYADKYIQMESRFDTFRSGNLKFALKDMVAAATPN